MIQKLRIEIKWAVLFALMMLSWMLMEELLGLHTKYIKHQAVVSMLVSIPAISFYVFALLEKRKKYYQNKMNYKQGLVSGIWLTVFYTLLSPAVQIIAVRVISPGFFQNSIKYAIETNQMSIQQATEYFTLSNFVVTTLWSSFVIGIITNIIVAIFTRKS